MEVIIATDFHPCGYFFNIFSTFWNPVVFFRLLVDSFFITPLSNNDIMPVAHDQIIGLIRTWIKYSFKNIAPVQKDLKSFFGQLAKAGGPYKASVERLLDGTVEAQVVFMNSLFIPSADHSI